MRAKGKESNPYAFIQSQIMPQPHTILVLFFTQSCSNLFSCPVGLLDQKIVS